MKQKLLLSLLTLLALTSCRFEYPFFVKTDLPIDRSIIGTWQIADNDGQINPDQNKKYVILPYSTTEYLILSGSIDGETTPYYRGYPVELGDYNAVQIEFIGTSNGLVDFDSNDHFTLVAYEFDDGILEIYMLNPEKIPQGTQSIAELQAALQEDVGDADLFGNLLRLKRDETSL